MGISPWWPSQSWQHLGGHHPLGSLNFSFLQGHGDFSMMTPSHSMVLMPPSPGPLQLFLASWGFLHSGHQSHAGVLVAPSSQSGSKAMEISPQWPPESCQGLGGTIQWLPSTSPCSMGVTLQWPPESCRGLGDTKLPKCLQGYGGFCMVATVMVGSCSMPS